MFQFPQKTPLGTFPGNSAKPLRPSKSHLYFSPLLRYSWYYILLHIFKALSVMFHVDVHAGIYLHRIIIILIKLINMPSTSYSYLRVCAHMCCENTWDLRSSQISRIPHNVVTHSHRATLQISGVYLSCITKTGTLWPTPLYFPLPQPLATAMLLSAFRSLTISDSTWKWDHVVFAFPRLVHSLNVMSSRFILDVVANVRNSFFSEAD